MRCEPGGRNHSTPGISRHYLETESLTLAHGVVLGPEGDVAAKEPPAGPILGAWAPCPVRCWLPEASLVGAEGAARREASVCLSCDLLVHAVVFENVSF